MTNFCHCVRACVYLWVICFYAQYTRSFSQANTENEIKIKNNWFTVYKDGGGEWKADEIRQASGKTTTP